MVQDLWIPAPGRETKILRKDALATLGKPLLGLLIEIL